VQVVICPQTVKIDDPASRTGRAPPSLHVAADLFRRCGLAEHDVAAIIEVVNQISSQEKSMTATQTAGLPALHAGPFNTAKSLGIDRGKTLKNPLAVHGAFEHIKQRGKVELIWGPLRHGVGHNIVFYFRDYTGNIMEYSAEEEIILNEATYVPRVWPVTDPRAADEWNLSHVPEAMM